MDNESKKVIVTGGAGFIGSHIVDELINKNYQVAVIDNLITGNKSNLRDNVPFYHIDIKEKEHLETVFSKERPDTVIHLAAQTSVGDSVNRPSYDGHNNILATINLLDCCKNYKVKKLIFASSAAVYGHTEDLPIKETSPLKPLSFYGLSKLTAEEYIQLYSKIFDLPYTILRFSNVYGERQNSHGEAGVISIFINQVFNQQPVVIFGDGQQTRDFIYVKDVVSANIAAIDNGLNETFNISTNHRSSVNEVVKSIAATTKKEIQSSYHPLRPGEIIDSQLCNEKAIKGLNWTPKYSLLEGLQEMLKYT
ncbi:NAD-dependent epimerase/dehydratase family protein [Bacillus sp. JJ634]